jgi:hypothetical protein
MRASSTGLLDGGIVGRNAGVEQGQERQRGLATGVGDDRVVEAQLVDFPVAVVVLLLQQKSLGRLDRLAHLLDELVRVVRLGACRRGRQQEEGEEQTRGDGGAHRL